MYEQIIKQVALFSSLPPNEVMYLSLNLREREFDAGTVFVRENQAAEHFYMLLEGQVEIIKELGTASECLLNVGHAGSYFGEMGLINPGSLRTASARARTPVRMLEMTRADFDALLRRHPALAYKMVRVLSLRLEEAENRNIRDLREKNVELSAACDRLRADQEQLVEKERQERESELAGEIQRRMVPREIPQRAGVDFGARLVPTHSVGGDFFDFIPLPNEMIGIALGDVSDKGVPAALLMALTSRLLRAEAQRGDSVSEILRRVNAHLLEITETGMSVTVVFGVLDGAAREFRYACAGHALPIIFHAEGEWSELPHTPGLPLGSAHELLLDEQKLTMAPGDTMVFHTDGAWTATGADGTPFGMERLRESVGIERARSAQALCDALIERITAFRAGTPQYDDIALVAVQVK